MKTGINPLTMSSTNARSMPVAPTVITPVDIIWLDHCYAKPWSAHPDASNARPLRMLFMNKYPRKATEKQSREADVIIDVDTVSDAASSSYDTSKAKNLMSECERNVNFARTEEIGDQWEERIASLRACWTPQQNRLFHKVVKALYSDRLARLSFETGPKEPIQRRIHIDKAARRIRQALAGVMWDIRITQWLHGVLVENLSQQLLGPYLDILQVLRSKVPSLVDKMIAPHINKCPGPSAEALSLLLKRPWDPATAVTHHNKLRKLPGNPLLLVVPGGPSGVSQPFGQTKRGKFWHSQLSTLGRVIQVVIHGSSGTSVAQCLENMIGAARTKVIELRGQHPNRPIVLIGWDVGALVACHVALIERVTAVVCLGFPLASISGQRGDVDDPILDNKIPTLFVIGQFSETCRVDELEDMREKMRAENSLLVVGGADAHLRVSRAKKKQEGVTQVMADRSIQDEVSEFLGGVIAQSAASGVDAEGLGDGETKRKSQSARKKKAPTTTPKVPGVSSAQATPSSTPQKSANRSRTASMSYFEQLMTSPDDQTQLSLSRSYDSKMLALGLQAQRSQAKQSSSKRKKSPSTTPGSSAKRRAIKTSSPADATSQVSNAAAPQERMSLPHSSSTELSGLLTGQLPQYLQTPATVAALQAAMGIRPSSADNILGQQLSQANLAMVQASLAPGLIPQQTSPVPVTATLAQRLAMTVSNLQERLKTSNSTTPPPMPNPAVSSPYVSPRTPPQATPPVKSQPQTVVQARSVPTPTPPADKTISMSPIKSALAAGPMPIRSGSQYGNTASQIQTLLSSMVRQTGHHGLSAAPAPPGFSPTVSHAISPLLPGAFSHIPASHGLSPVHLLGLEAHQQLQYAASLAAISPSAGSMTRLPGPYVHTTMVPPKPIRLTEPVQSQAPLTPTARVLLPASPGRPEPRPAPSAGQAMSTTVLPSIHTLTQAAPVQTLAQAPTPASVQTLTPAPVQTPAQTHVKTPVQAPVQAPVQKPAQAPVQAPPTTTGSQTSSMQSDKEKILAIQKLQFHDFPLTTATINKSTGVTKITQAKILDHKLPEGSPAVYMNVGVSRAPQLATSRSGIVTVTSSSRASVPILSVPNVPHTLSVARNSSPPSTPKPSVAKVPGAGAVVMATEPLGQVQSIVESNIKKTVVLSRPTDSDTNASSTINVTASMINIPKATVLMTSSPHTMSTSVPPSNITRGVSISGLGPDGSSISTGPLTQSNPKAGTSEQTGHAETQIIRVIGGESNRAMSNAATPKTGTPSVTVTRTRRPKTPKQ